jgi:hypothetical protein
MVCPKLAFGINSRKAADNVASSFVFIVYFFLLWKYFHNDAKVGTDTYEKITQLWE